MINQAEIKWNRMIRISLLSSITALFVLLFFQSTYAQWEPMNGPEGGSVRALLIDGETVLAGIWGGVYRYKTADGIWRNASNGLVTDWSVLCFARINQTILAGSEADGVFISTDTGTSWQMSKNGLAREHISSLAADDSNFYAATGNGTVCYMRNGTQNWVYLPVKFSVSSALSSVAVIGQYVIVAAAGYSSELGIYRSARTTGTWQAWQKTQTGIKTNQLFVRGAYVFSGGDNGVYRSADSGKTWTLMNAGFPSATRVKCLAADTAYLYAADDNGRMFRSANAGQSWVKVGFNLPSGYWPFGLAASATRLYACSQDDGVLLSTNQGMSWTPVNKGLYQRRIFNVETKGEYVFANSEFGRIFISSDKGISWSSVDPGLLADSEVRCLKVKGQSLFAGTWGSGIFRTDDNGVTWVPVNKNLTELYIYSLSVCGSDLYAGSSNDCFRSSDNGGSWVESYSGLRSNCHVRGVVKTGNSLLAAASDSVYRSDDSGATWVPAVTGLVNTVWAIAGMGRYAFTGGRGISRTENGGVTWVKSDSGMAFEGVHALLSHNGILFAGTTSGNVYSSHDSGSFWSLVGPTTPPTYNAVEAFAINDNYLYAGTMLRSVWRCPAIPAGVVLRQKPSDHNKTEVLTVSATNQRVSGIAITYTLPNRGLVTIRIVDVFGRVCFETLQKHESAGKHTIRPDIRPLASGCYIVSMQADRVAEFRKVLVP